MDQPRLHGEESEALNTLSDTFCKSLAVPIPSTPTSEGTTTTNIAETPPAQQKQHITIAGLKIPNYRYLYGFYGLAFGLSYKKFLIRLAELNPSTLTRPAAEKAWQSITCEKFKEWNPDPKQYNAQKKRRLLRDAHSQMRSKGLKGFDVEKFWRNWEEIAVWGRKEQEKKEANMSNEMFKQEKWKRGHAKREENRRIKGGARNHGMPFSAELPLRPKSVSPTKQPTLSGPAVFPGVSEQNFVDEDDEMKP